MESKRKHFGFLKEERKCSDSSESEVKQVDFYDLLVNWVT